MTVRTAGISGYCNLGLRFVGLGGAALALLAVSAPVLAQDGNDETRLRKIEAEVRALQRRVFPGGDGRYFEPEITGQPQANTMVTQPSTTAVTDILARLDAMETQIQRLTGQTEQNTFALRTLSERLDALEAGPVLGGRPVGSAGGTSAPGTATGSSTPAPTPTPAPAPAAHAALIGCGGYTVECLLHSSITTNKQTNKSQLVDCLPEFRLGVSLGGLVLKARPSWIAKRCGWT